MNFIQRRPITDTFTHFLWQTKVILLVWAKFIAGVWAVTLIFGPIVALVSAALLFTFALPIAILTLWGFSLDKELQWGEMDEGPR